MAKTLILSMEKPFEPEKYHNEYQQKLKAMIQDKIDGKEIVEPKESVTTIIDIMEALKQSIEIAKNE